MSEEQRLVGATEFAKETGLSRQAFYRCKSDMVKSGVLTQNAKKIDIHCRWMQNYLSNIGKGHKSHVDVQMPAQDNAESYSFTPEEIPDMAKLQHLELLEKVKKGQLDNAIKAKKVVSTVFMRGLVDSIDEVLNNIIVDGQASFLPKLILKIRSGYTDEQAGKFWHDEVHKIIAPVKPRLKRAVRKEMDG